MKTIHLKRLLLQTDCSHPGLRLSPAFFSLSLIVMLFLVFLYVSLFHTGNCEADQMKTSRKSILAGSWYSANKTELADDISTHLSAGLPLTEIAYEAPIAIIAPHAGHQWSGDAAGTVFRFLSGPAGENIKRVILLGPAHQTGFKGASILPVDQYETPLGAVELDTEIIQQLLSKPLFTTNRSSHRQEHCLEIELPFLQQVLQHEFKLVPILISILEVADWSTLAETLVPFIDRETVLIVSSDFTHYGSRFGYLPFADDLDLKLKELDFGALNAIEKIDPQQWAAYHSTTGITVCGYQPIGILLETLLSKSLAPIWGKQRPEGRIIDYYRSGDLTGDFDNSVSYASVAFFRAGKLHPGETYPPSLQPVCKDEENRTMHLNPSEKEYLLQLARETLTCVLDNNSPPEPDQLPDNVSSEKLNSICGVFVTLTRQNRLRGCIGTIIGHEPLIEGVINKAISSALEDPRFPPVTAKELPLLEIEISILTPLQRAKGPDEIVIGRHGVLLEKDGHRAVFLPQVAPEQGWDRDTMLDHLTLKAGLPKDAWRSNAFFDLFEAFVFSEDDL